MNNIDASFTSAVAAATALGNAVVRIPPAAIPVLDAGTTSETIQTDVLSYTPKGGTQQIGFRVTAVITIGGYSVSKFTQTLPVAKSTAWPANIEGLAQDWALSALLQADKWVSSHGYTPAGVASVYNHYNQALVAAAGIPANVQTAAPKLYAVYNWLISVLADATAGKSTFTTPPYTPLQVLQEAFPSS